MAENTNFADKLWRLFSNESMLLIHTPVVISLASGNLLPDSFNYLVAQQICMLRCFSKLYEVCAEGLNEYDKASIKKLVIDINKTADHLKTFMCQSTNEYPVSLTTQKYRQFLLKTASGRVKGVNQDRISTLDFTAYTMAAMTPHLQVYSFIAKKISECLASTRSNNRYNSWISYCCNQCSQLSKHHSFWMDKLYCLRTEECWIFTKLYLKSLKLELRIFSDQPVKQRTIVPLILRRPSENHQLLVLSSFHTTCTVKDTCKILVAMPKKGALKSDVEQSQIQDAQMKERWKYHVKYSTMEYKKCISNILLSSEVGEFNYIALEKALKPLSDTQKRANINVFDSGLLKSLDLEDIKSAGYRLVLKDRCMGFFESVTNSETRGASIHIISTCWSSDIIKSAFSSAGGSLNIDVHSNELVYKELISTGQMLRWIETPFDKVNCLYNIIKEHREKVVIYIGHSVTDLLCLLQADIGIVMGFSDKDLRRVANCFGVNFVSLFDALVQNQKKMVQGSTFSWRSVRGVLYTVSSWSELHGVIMGC